MRLPQWTMSAIALAPAVLGQSYDLQTRSINLHECFALVSWNLPIGSSSDQADYVCLDSVIEKTVLGIKNGLTTCASSYPKCDSCVKG